MTHNGASTVRLMAIAGLLFLLRRKAASVEKIGESVFPDHRWRHAASTSQFEQPDQRVGRRLTE
jgi:hypothetical protein